MDFASRRWGVSRRTWTLFLVILALGIFARVWEFRTLPPGLHHDEAAIGMEAYYLYRYGVDRNNISFPIHFIGWGNGQNAPYAYLLIPLIALLGLSVPVIRLPILISGIVTLPFVYLIFRRTVDERFGLLAMFCVAISPWHILLSRWGLESNLLPFFFCVGYFFLLKSREDWRWFIAANLLFALCLYTYGITYAFLPIFLLAAVLILSTARILRPPQIGFGLIVLALCALPVLLFVVINILGLDSLHLGRVTIPRMPTLSRFQQEGAMFHSNALDTIVAFFSGFLRLLIVQDDLRARNGFPPFGYFYQVTFPLAVLGIWALTRSLQPHREEKLLWLSWLGSASILGALEPVIINRINIIFIPLIAAIAYCIYWLGRRIRPAVPLAVALLSIAFLAFTYAYHAGPYGLEAGREFYTGLLPAIRLAQERSPGPICVTTAKVYQPYIFILYTERKPPADFLAEIEYRQPVTPLREVLRLGRYTFGLENCGQDANTTYVLFHRERLEHMRDYQRKRFDNFIVYLPKQ